MRAMGAHRAQVWSRPVDDGRSLMAANDEPTELSTTTGPAGDDVATGRGEAGANGHGVDAGVPDGAAAPAAEPAPAKKAARKRAPRKATAARTTPAHHDAEPV